MRDNEERYDLELSRYKTGFVDGLKQRMEEGGAGRCYGFVLGTRKGDPNCGVQTSFTPSRSAPVSARLRHLFIACVDAQPVFSLLEKCGLKTCLLVGMATTFSALQ